MIEDDKIIIISIFGVRPIFDEISIYNEISFWSLKENKSYIIFLENDEIK